MEQVADSGNKTKKVGSKRGELTTTKLVETGHFVTSLQTNKIIALGGRDGELLRLC